MARFILRRLLWIVLTMVWVSVLTFVMVLAGPGDPAEALVGPKAMGVSIEQVRKQYGLDQPIYVQYVTYMRNVLRGDLGYSYYFRRPVSEAMLEKLPATAMLAVSIILVAIAIGIPAGCIAALRSNRIADQGIMFVGLLWISLPTFFL